MSNTVGRSMEWSGTRSVEAGYTVSDETVSDETVVEPLDEPPAEPGLTVTIDGRAHQARPGQLVIDACADAGAYIPHFCYHPRMSPVGMCRQCLVEVEGPRGPMMVVSCMTPVADGQVVRTDTDQVKRAQEGVLELLLANHPLDCPVCDKGGECPLQDQAFSHGPGESRYLEQKRNYEKPIPISDLVYLDRERCILCDRCTRFADEVAGDKLIHFISRGNDTQVMTFPDEPFSSYFSGNTVQICPVGALTAKPYRFKARPWDLEQLESTCTSCSVGCRTVIQSSRDELLRYQGVDSEPVNWGWLCDRGRFNFEAVNSDQRLQTPLIRTEDGLVETSWNSALTVATQMFAEAAPDRVAIIGGARGTNESAFAWAKLADAVGVGWRDAQIGDGLDPALLLRPRATIAEAASATTVVLLGPDLKEELPVLYLRLRDAAEKRRSRLIEFAPIETGLSRYCWKQVSYEPGEAARIITETCADTEVAEQLQRGDVVVVVGRSNLAESPLLITEALDALMAVVPEAKILPVLRRGNVNGALALGLAPTAAERDTPAALRAAADGQIDLLVLLGADPIADLPDTDLAKRAIEGAYQVIAVDTFLNSSSERADLVLPAAAYGEQSGTTTNLEGRVSTVTSKVTVTGTSRPDWMIAAELALMLGHDLGIGSVNDLTEMIAASVPGFAGVTGAALERQRDGIVVTPVVTSAPSTRRSDSIAPRNSYDYRLICSRTMYDAAVQTAMSPSLAPLAPGPGIFVNPADLDHIGVPVGNEVKVTSAKASAIMPLGVSQAVPRGLAWVPFNQPGSTVGAVIDAGAMVCDVRIERP
jgi:NADH-quinone oxidoreductase subunit G